jgi:class 3 adenylate cyclase
MGFGLHAGWAIEGAVGSLQKVDATYLSPHVNMAAMPIYTYDTFQKQVFP